VSGVLVLQEEERKGNGESEWEREVKREVGHAAFRKSCASLWSVHPRLLFIITGGLDWQGVFIRPGQMASATAAATATAATTAAPRVGDNWRHKMSSNGLISDQGAYCMVHFKLVQCSCPIPCVAARILPQLNAAGPSDRCPRARVLLLEWVLCLESVEELHNHKLPSFTLPASWCNFLSPCFSTKLMGAALQEPL
jgi:hypothetical protein